MELRSIALATTALVAIATFAQPAAAGGSSYMGKVNLGFGNAWEDWSDGGESNNDISLDYTTLHGSASVNVPYNDRVNVQFDIFGNESLDEAFDGSPNGSFYGGFGAGLHLNYRDPEVGALGVFGAVGRANVGGSSSSDMYVFAAGLEGEYYCNAWTLKAQAGYLDSDDSGYLIREAGFIRAGAAFYPSKHLKLSGDVGYLDGTDGTNRGSDDVDEWNWNFTVEYLFGQTVPVSTYMEYKGQSTEEHVSGGVESDRHEVRAGVRFYFGGDSDLQKADREGAGLQSPDILTWPRYDF
ncbi:MAG: hypothetical protein K8S25_02865 [Alphaproteobacteria bacterium]|nr:hypothetical protein [Alphaproteobacteria bacterium]